VALLKADAEHQNLLERVSNSSHLQTTTTFRGEPADLENPLPSRKDWRVRERSHQHVAACRTRVPESGHANGQVLTPRPQLEGLLEKHASRRLSLR
jgi:hypothetical protein